jgi:hypothetical protein
MAGKKTKSEKPPGKKKRPPQMAPTDGRDKDAGYDFGGLPAIDLKKNLGCG